MNTIMEAKYAQLCKEYYKGYNAVQRKVDDKKPTKEHKGLATWNETKATLKVID